MPNWCMNTIEIIGPRDQIQLLLETAHYKDNNLLEAMVPIGDWEYDKALAAWGVKWGMETDSLVLEHLEDGLAAIRGPTETPWDPPIQAFTSFANAHPECTLSIKYFEPGMNFIGEWNSTLGDQHWEINDQVLTSNSNSDELDSLLEHFDVNNWYDICKDPLVEWLEDGEQSILPVQS